MKNFLRTLTFLLTFLGLFIYSYKRSRKFRKSIASALFAALVIVSWPAQSTAKGVHGFSTPESSRPAKRSGFFSGKSDTNGPGKPGKPDGGDGDDGEKPQYTTPESVEETKERVEWVQKQVRQLEEETDSESESECGSAERFQVDESYKSNLDLKKVTRNAHKNERAVKNLKDVQKKLSEGENPMKIGYKPTNLGNGFYYIKKPDARIVVKLDQTTGNSDIVGFALRSNEKDMEKLAIVINSECDTKIKINPKAY